MKTVEAQLKQSIPKKEHEEIVSTLQSNIERLTADLQKTKAELEKLSDLNEKIRALSESISAQNKAILQQTKSIEILAKKINDGTVPMNIHQQALSKQREYEERFSQMVPKEDYIVIQKKYEELLEKQNYMVPRSELEALQAKNSELEERISKMVPREELLIAEQKLQQMEAKMANYVPRSDYDELASKIVALAEEATSSSYDESIEEKEPTIEARNEQEAQEQPAEVPQPTPQETQTVEQVGIQMNVAVTQVETVKVESQPEPQTEVAITSYSGDSSSSEPIKDNSFTFENTELHAKTPVEFLEDLEKVPIETVQSHFIRGDFERWFREYLSDEASAEALKAIRESNFTGEELRSKIIQTIAARYTTSQN